MEVIVSVVLILLIGVYPMIGHDAIDPEAFNSCLGPNKDLMDQLKEVQEERNK